MSTRVPFDAWYPSRARVRHNVADGPALPLVEPPELHQRDRRRVGDHDYAATLRAASVAASRIYSERDKPRFAAAARSVRFSSSETRSLMLSIMAGLMRIMTNSRVQYGESISAAQGRHSTSSAMCGTIRSLGAIATTILHQDRGMPEIEGDANAGIFLF